MLCTNCQKPLEEHQWKGKDVKSCPGCSQKLGVDEHVFYPYPAAFGTTTARSTTEHEEGPQSHCKNCREWGRHNEKPRLCSEVRPIKPIAPTVRRK